MKIIIAALILPKRLPKYREGGEDMPADDTNEILQRLTRLETKLDMMGTAKEVANEALQSARSAHHRLEEIEDNQRWLWRTVIGGLIAGAISLIWRGIGS